MSQLAPETPIPPQSGTLHLKRKRGGQPGNTNALKHGRYLAGYRLRHAAVAEVHPPDIDELIERITISIQHTFETGIHSDNLAESNQALRTISLAAIGLVRLINLSCKANNSRIASVQDQLSLAASKALIAKYRQARADGENYPIAPQSRR